MKQVYTSTEKTLLRRHFETFRGREISDRHWRNERRLLGIVNEENWVEADLITLEGLAWLRAAKQRANRGRDLARDAYFWGCALRGVTPHGASGAQLRAVLQRAFLAPPSRTSLHRLGVRLSQWCDRALLLRVLRWVLKSSKWTLQGPLQPD